MVNSVGVFDSLVLSWFARGDVCGWLVCLGGL